MTSSPIPAARSRYLLGLLAQVPDPRKRRGRRHPLAGLLGVGIAAVIAGSRSFAAIGQWAADAVPEVLAVMGAARGPAEESTFRRAFAQLILGRGADYVVTVKATMPTLYRQLKKLPWASIPAVSSVSTDHGRRACRTVTVALAPPWTGFDGAAQVAQLRRTVTKKGTKTVEVACLITSDRSASPETLAAWVRGHRETGNRLHQAGKTLRRSTTSRPRCGYGRRACWAWRQRLGC